MTDWFKRMNTMEPARVRAVWTAVVALLVSAGIVIPANVDDGVKAAIVLFFTLLPMIQGESTRTKVSPVADDDFGDELTNNPDVKSMYSAPDIVEEVGDESP